MQKQKSWIYSRELPLNGKSALIIEDNALVAIRAEFTLRDAGAAVVRIANSVASAKSALDEGFPFDVAWSIYIWGIRMPAPWYKCCWSVG